MTVELERLIPHEALTIPYFGVPGASSTDVEDSFDIRAGVTDIRLVDSVEDACPMRAAWIRKFEGVLRALAATDLVVRSGVGTDGGWRFEVRG